MFSSRRSLCSCRNQPQIVFQPSQLNPFAHSSHAMAAAVRETEHWQRCPRCDAVVADDVKVTRCLCIDFHHGLETVHVRTYFCKLCERFLCGCWSWAPNNVNQANFEGWPVERHFCLFTLSARSGSIAGMTVETMRFLTCCLVNTRSSFRGFWSLLSDYHCLPHNENMHKKIAHAWVVYECIGFLTPAHPCLQDVPFCFDRNDGTMRPETLSRLYLPLQDKFMEAYAREHMCTKCYVQQVVSFDGKVNAAVPVCACREGSLLHLQRGDVVLEYGCCKPPRPGSNCCSVHHSPAAVSKTDSRCPSDHTLRRKVAAAAFTCSRCQAHVAKKGVLWQCSLGCDFSLCHACCCPQQAANADQSEDAVFAPSVSTLDLSSQSLAQSSVQTGNVGLHESALLLEVTNPCGIYKQPVTAHSRMHGNVLTAMLACGRVCFIMPMAGHESVTQVFGMLAAVRTRRPLQYVVYDNACCLARFVRGLHRRAPSGVRQQCAQLTYVLDRWHRQNHTACVDPDHPLYLPEVKMESHPVLRDYNSSNSEQFNAWLELFVSITRSMRPETYDCFVVLIARLWNEFIIPKRDAGTLPLPLERTSRLKRSHSRASVA